MLYKRLIINGKEYLLAVSQAGSGAPAATDPGSPGILYMDTDTGDLYKCSGGEDGAWAWKKLSEGGSGYTLPIGGENLGGVKNGGNVVINEDGTMDAPNHLGIAGATVGQIARITAVDEVGTPTAWEAVDMPDSITVGAELGIISPFADGNNAIFTGKNGEIYTV